MSLNIIQQKEPDTTKQIDIFIEAAAKQFQRVENQRAEIIRDLAAKISELDGIEKSKIARIIVRGFRHQNVSINKSYIYSVLGQEYKNAAQSEASSQTQKELREDGFDKPTKTFVNGKTYNPDLVAEYSRSTLVRIVNDQREEIISLKKRIEELEQHYIHFPS
jgi:hypothetical protein